MHLLRLRALLLCGCGGAAGLEVAALRAANAGRGQGFTYPANFGAYYYQHTPLDARLLPLCGNGVVNTRADYEAYYAGQPGQGYTLNVSAFANASRTSMGDGLQNFRLVADEVCDDGGRLDGDGCSADCLDRDAMLPACALAAPDIGGYEFLLYYNDTVYAVGANGVYTLTLTTGGLAATQVASADLNAQGAEISAGGVIYMYQAGGAVSQWSPTGGYTSPCAVAGPATGTFAQFVRGWSAATAMAVVLATAGGDVLLADAGTCAVLATLAYAGASLRSAPGVHVARLSATLPPCTSGLAVDGGRATLYCGIVSATFTPQGDAFFDGAGGQLTGDLWTDYLRLGLTPFLRADMTEPPRWAAQMRGQPDKVDGVSGQVVAHTVFARFMQSVRTLLVAGTPMLLQGSTSMQAVVTGGTDPCYAEGVCALDTPLASDVLPLGLEALITGTYYDVLQETLLSAPSAADAAGYTNYSALFVNTVLATTLGRLTSSAMRHGRTQGVWFAVGKQLFEIGFGGTQYVFADGQCLPSVLGSCAAACEWAPLGGSCKPCATAPAANATNDERVAHALLCGAGCPAARRRLLAVDAQVVVTFAVLVENQSAAPPGAACAPAGMQQWLCNVSVTGDDSVAALRAANALLTRNGSWTVVTRPALVVASSSAPNVPPVAATQPSAGLALALWVIAAIAIGGTAVLIGGGLLLYYCCLI